MAHSISLTGRNRYELIVYGQPDELWKDWLGEAKIRVEVPLGDEPVTTFVQVIMDQAALVGLIRRLHGLGVVLLSIRAVNS